LQEIAIALVDDIADMLEEDTIDKAEGGPVTEEEDAVVDHDARSCHV
jgi:hypothetical protein